MKINTRKDRSAIGFKPAQVVSAFCREQAIDCGYAALASAIEGKAWERRRYLNLMRRLGTLNERVHGLLS